MAFVWRWLFHAAVVEGLQGVAGGQTDPTAQAAAGGWPRQ
jgi:hypothetical protein